LKNRLLIGILFLVFGVAIAIAPQTIFPVCGVRSAHSAMSEMGDNSANNSQTTMTKKHMKCWYTGRWEIVVGSIISLFGLLILLFKDKKIRIILSIFALIGGIFALLIPTILVGVCGNKNMDCQTMALPALIIFSSAVILTALVNIVYLARVRK
jgi:hypothetical protein